MPSERLVLPLRASSSSRLRLLEPLGATPDSSLLASLLVKLMNIGAALPEPLLADPLPAYRRALGDELMAGLFVVGGADAGGCGRTLPIWRLGGVAGR